MTIDLLAELLNAMTIKQLKEHRKDLDSYIKDREKDEQDDNDYAIIEREIL